VASAALLGILIILLCTRWGAGLGDDSYWYIKPVRDVLAGERMELNAAFPPFLPILLTGIGFLGIDPLDSIRILNAILFGVTAFLAFLTVYEISGSFTFSFLASAAILVSAGPIEVFSSALSDPLYICLTLGSIFCGARFSTDRKRPWHIAASVLAGLSLLTRYAGIATVISIGLFLLLRDDSSWRGRARDGLVFGVVSMAPVGVFIGRNWLVLGRPIGLTDFSWALVREFPVRRLVQDVLDWVVPGKLVAGREFALASLVLAAVLVVLLAYAIVYRQRFVHLATEIARTPAFAILALFAGSTLLMLTFARGFFAGGDSFNPRYLSPVHIVAIMMFYGVLGKAFAAMGTISRILVGATCVGAFAVIGLRGAYTMQFLNRVGSGYASQRWHISETIAYLNHRPDTPVMSTAAAGVYFWTGRRPLDVPHSPEEVKQFLCDTGGFLVVIDSMPLEFYGIDAASVTEGLTVEQDFSEGTIYRMDPENCR
jgi:hypothetical protein